jgi:hypothetical protein
VKKIAFQSEIAVYGMAQRRLCKVPFMRALSRADTITGILQVFSMQQ